MTSITSRLFQSRRTPLRTSLHTSLRTLGVICQRIVPLILLALTAITTSSCSDESPVEAQRFSLRVQVRYPATYFQTGADSAAVQIRNAETGIVENAVTSSNGEARFTNLLPGRYDVTARRPLTASQVLTLTGNRTEQGLQLNAALSGFRLLSASDSVATLTLSGSPVGNLVIKEVYWTGSTTRNGVRYFSDQFYEIYNNSTDSIYTDSLCIADVWGASGSSGGNFQPTDFRNDSANVYLSTIWMIAGTGRERLLLPGQSIVIAQDGINHRADTAFTGVQNRTVDLSNADWETFNLRDDGRDTDSPVPNMTRVYYNGGFDWNVNANGPAIVIFKAFPTMLTDSVRIPSSPTLRPRIRMPNTRIIDACEALQNAGSRDFKRIPTALDAGFQFAGLQQPPGAPNGAPYSSESMRRKVVRRVGTRAVLQDFNNSTDDFDVINPPTPKLLP
jgi:hypothetical protein